MSAPGYERGEKLPSGSYAGSGGAPSSYDPSYCEKVIEWGKQGKSRAWICDELGVVRNTLKNWENMHPEFLMAMQRAKLAEQRWWEDAGQGGMASREFNAAVWGRSMGARFPDDWREKSDNKHTLEAGDTLAALIGKIGAKTQSVFPGDDDES